MQGDTLLSPTAAAELHSQAYADGKLPMWTITWNSSDYPYQAVARPHLVAAGEVWAAPNVLVAESLDALRQLLPDGLTRMERSPDDDPVIVEVWL